MMSGVVDQLLVEPGTEPSHVAMLAERLALVDL